MAATLPSPATRVAIEVKSFTSRPKPISATTLPPSFSNVSLNTLALRMPALRFSSSSPAVRPARGVFILTGEFVAVDGGLVELLERKLHALLVLRTEIRARPRHRQQPADLDRLILGIADGGARDQTDRNAKSQHQTRLHAH